MGRNWFFLLSFFLLVLVLYGRSLSYEFVYDDHTRIKQNPAIQTLAHPTRFLWDPGTQAGSRGKITRDTYRPLVTLNFALDYQVAGKNPFFYRFENILLHALNGFLLFLLLTKIFQLSPWPSYLGAFLFLCHPVQTEPVAWISGRSSLLMVFFILVGWHFWHMYKIKKDKPSLAVVYVSFILALLSREHAVFFPFILFFGDLLKKREKPILWVQYRELFLMAFLYGLMRIVLLDTVGQKSFWGTGFLTNMANVFKYSVMYFKILVWPHPLSPTYSDLPVVRTFLDKGVVLGIFIWSALIGVGFFSRKKVPLIGFSLIFFFLFWLPGSNILPLRMLFAERHLYPMIIPVAILAAYGLEMAFGLLKNKSMAAKIACSSPLALMFLVFSFLTVKQVGVWKNDLTLWEHATQVRPAAWFGWSQRGWLEFNKGEEAEEAQKPDLAKEWFRKSKISYEKLLQLPFPRDRKEPVLLKLEKIKTNLSEIVSEDPFLKRGHN